MSRLKLAAGSMLLAFVAACGRTDPIPGAQAQQPAPSTVFYPDPVESPTDGQVFEYY